MAFRQYDVKPTFGSNPTLLNNDVPNENRGPAMLAWCTVLTSMALLTVMARAFVLGTMSRVAGYDDAAIVVSMVLSITALGVVIALALNGSGRHSKYLSADTIKKNRQLSFARQFLYLWAVTILKISIALFLNRFSPNRHYRRFLKIFTGFITVTTICATLAVLLQCQPVPYVWDKSMLGTCYSADTLTAVWYTINGVSITTDIIYSVLTLPMLWSVQIKRRVKAVIVGIMALGLFAAAAAGIKVYYITKCCSIGDGVFDGTYITIWAAAECNLGIIAASIPCLRPLFGRYFGHERHEHRARSARSAHSNRTGSEHTHETRSVINILGWHPHLHICSHEKSPVQTIISHNYASGDITPHKEAAIFGQAISERRTKTEGDASSAADWSMRSVDGRHWERRESPYYRQNLDSLVNDVELGDVRVMYANMSRAMLGPVMHNSDTEGSGRGRLMATEYEDVAYMGRKKSSNVEKKDKSRRTTRL